MQIMICKREGYKPYISIIANELVYKVETVDEWIRELRIARAWLKTMPTQKDPK